MSPAPDFYNGYPSGGEVISVAWQAAWDELETEMVPRPELQAIMVERSGCAPKTANNLVSKALRYRRLAVAERSGGVALLCRYDLLEGFAPHHPSVKKGA